MIWQNLKTLLRPSTGVHKARWVEIIAIGKFGDMNECQTCKFQWRVSRLGKLPSHHWMDEGYERTNEDYIYEITEKENK